MENFKPLGIYISVKVDDVPEKTKGGLIIADPLKGKPKTGMITDLPVENYLNTEYFEDGKFCGMSLGDKVLFFGNGGVEYDENYFLKIDDLIAIDGE